MSDALTIIRSLIGHKVRLFYESLGSGASYEIEGVLEDVSDGHIVVRSDSRRVFIMNVLVIEVHDYGEVSQE